MTNREMLVFVEAARQLAADYKAKGMNPSLELPDGMVVRLLDPEQDELMDELEALAVAGLARGEP